ncbi:MAG: NADPH-dependent reductase [Bacteroidetes bacterium]|nr:NADPH-dependent reductase [Bacteroidota bacterium]
MYNLKIITTTTRPGRKGPILAAWIIEIAKKYPEFNVEFIDLGEINLPMMDEAMHPRFQKYEHEHTKKWAATIDGADAFLFVTAEYNYSMTAPIINALDYLFHEWANKPAAFVSYGGASGGTRAVQMLKLTLTTLKVVPVTEAVVLPFFGAMINEQNAFVSNEGIDKSADVMLKELLRWTEILKPTREK